MSLVHELSASVELCFTLYSVPTDGLLLSKTDQAQLSEISSILQPVLMRLQKQAVVVTETQELYADDEELLSAVVNLRRALQRLQAASARCCVPHWLVRVLVAADVRQGLQSGIRDTADALGQLLAADGAADVGPLQEVAQLQQALVSHKVSAHESLERLATGLYRHMEQASDAEQVVSMLRFVVREAQNLSLRRKQGHASRASSSSSRGDSDAGDVSTSRVAAADASNNSNNHNSSSNGGGASGSASSMDASSDSSSGSSSKQKNNGKASSSSKPGDVPPGETSLTDVHLLLAVQQLADTKTGTQQLVLHQVLSILEELHEAKASALKHKQMKRLAAAGAAGASHAHGHLTSVPEGVDDMMSIAAVRQDSDLQPSAAGHHHQLQQRAAAQRGADGSAAAAAGSHGGAPATYGAAVAAMSSGLEELLVADPWDTAALTQLMELLMQAAAEEQFATPEEEEYADGGGDDARDVPGTNRDQGGRKSSSGPKWWGSVGKAAKAALGSARTAGSSKQSAASKAASEEAAMVAQAKRERLHKLVVAAADVLLRLTPRPASTESCFAPASRPGLPPNASLALPLMAHCDSAPALAACIWSSGNDAAIKAARLLGIIISSETQLGALAAAAAAGLAGSPEAIHANFCHNVATSGGVSGSAWHGLVALLHNSNLSAAAAGAEALAAIGASSRSGEMCSAVAATQAARPLLVLLAKHQAHPAAAGSAAAALAALADARTRPATRDVLVSSYCSGVAGVSVPLGDTLIALMLGSDSLAACRAADLAAGLASGIDWGTAPSSGGAPGNLWAETFRAGQHMLQRPRGSSASCDAATPSVCGARLLQKLVQHGCKASSSSGSSSRGREDMSFEALLLAVQKLVGYNLTAHGGASLAGKEGRVAALLELVNAVLGASSSEGRLCGILPELFERVVPVLQVVTRKGGASSSSLQDAASQLHEKLMVLGG